jgi:hypothetical protein
MEESVRTMRSFGLRIAAAMLLGACGDSEREPCDTGRRCVADPDPHCVSASSCSRDSECPAGLRCAPDLDGNCRTSEDDAVTCRPTPPQAFNAFALREGFQVSELSLHPDETGQPTLVWTAPAQAGFVSCAIFQCPPVFAQTGNKSVDETKDLQVIYNFSSCAVVHRVVAAEEGAFALTAGGETYDREASEPVCDPVESSADEVRAATGLVAGCWAYDFNRVVRASNLIQLRADQVAGIELPSTACDGGDGQACIMEPSTAFGTCLDGACRHSCVTALDCELAAGDESTPGEPGPCGWDCVDVGDSLGVCRPRPT